MSFVMLVVTGVSFMAVVGPLSFLQGIVSILICGILTVIVSSIIWAVATLALKLMPSFDAKDASKAIVFWKMLSFGMLTVTIMSFLVVVSGIGMPVLMAILRLTSFVAACVLLYLLARSILGSVERLTSKAS